MRHTRKLAALGIAAALVIGLSACSNDSSDDGAAGASNGATATASASDVAFAQAMIPHHQQAVAMADMALDPASGASAEVQDLATQIKAAQDPDVVIVDIRDPREIERDGKIPGAFSCTRGMLEFWIDPQSPYAKPIFQEDKKFIFHCAGGLRSALAAKTAQDMGLKPVAHMGGGFAAWRDAGGPIEKWEPKKKG